MTVLRHLKERRRTTRGSKPKSKRLEGMVVPLPAVFNPKVCQESCVTNQ